MEPIKVFVGLRHNDYFILVTEHTYEVREAVLFQYEEHKSVGCVIESFTRPSLWAIQDVIAEAVRWIVTRELEAPRI